MRPLDPSTAELSIQRFANGAEVLLLRHSDGTERVLARKWATDATVWDLMKKGLQLTRMERATSAAFSKAAIERKLAEPHSCLHQPVRTTQDWADRNNLGEILTGVVDEISEDGSHGEFTHRVRLDAQQDVEAPWAAHEWLWMKPQDLEHLPSTESGLEQLRRHGFDIQVDPDLPQDVIRIGDTEIKIRPPEDDGETS